MQPYKNLSGNSGVRGYEVRGDAIVLYFREGRGYLYDRHKPGAKHVAEMQRLALAGRGLATYLNKYVRDNYARKL
jgi:hypothetical protein